MNTFFSAPTILKLCIIFAALSPLPTYARGIVVKDYVADFVSGYQQLSDSKTQRIATYAISYESRHHTVLDAAYYGTMSPSEKQRLRDSAASQYVNLPQDIAKYNAQAKLIKQILIEVEDRYKKLLNTDLKFDVYLWSSIVDTDGNSFTINGKPAFAINLRLAVNYNIEQLRILLAHEAYHLYQDANLKYNEPHLSLVQRALWSEGWATYVSSVIYPGLPDWKYVSYYHGEAEYHKFEEHKQEIIALLEKNLGSEDSAMFGKFFSASPEMSAPLPPRSGYFIGYKMAQELAKEVSAVEIANMQAADFLSVERRLLRKIE